MADAPHQPEQHGKRNSIGNFWAESTGLMRQWTKAALGIELWEERFTDVLSLTQFNQTVSYKSLTAYYCGRELYI